MSTTAIPPTIPSDSNNTSIQLNKLKVTKGDVTIATFVAGAVEGSAGVITISAVSTATATEETPVLITNSHCGATNVVLVSIGSYGGTIGTDGSPTVWATPAAGGFTLHLANDGVTAAALTGSLTINYLIV